MNKSVIKIIVIVAVLAVVGGLGYYFYRKGSKSEVDSLPAVDTGDQAAYDQIYNYLKANIDPAAVDGWIGDSAKNYYTGAVPIPDSGYLVGGQITKSGSLLAAWATGYYPNPGYVFKQDRDTINNELYRIFYQYKGTRNKL